MRGDKESTRKTFAAKLVVSGKQRTWITRNEQATGPSNIHAFGALAGFFPAGPCRWRLKGESPRGMVTEGETVHKTLNTLRATSSGSNSRYRNVLRHSRDLHLRRCRPAPLLGELRHCRRQGPGALHPAKVSLHEHT